MAAFSLIGVLLWANFIYVFVHPLFFLEVFLPSTWAITLLYLAWTSPHRRAVKWWFMMPLTSLGGTFAGTFLAGMLLWLPTMLLSDFHLPRTDELELPVIYYLVFAGGVSVLFSTHYARRLDRSLHS